jgi:hypothetical protein
MANVDNHWNVKGPDGLKALALKRSIKVMHDNGKWKRKDDMMKTIKKHVKALHKTEGANIHDLDCYQATVQAFDRRRKRKPLKMKTSPEAKSVKRYRKKLQHSFVIVNVKFKGQGLFVDRHGVLRCHCDRRDKGNMDTDGLNSCVKASIQKKWEAMRDEEQQLQAHI